MPRPTRTGTRGLYRDGEGRHRIDLRYVAPDGTPQRYRERLPPGLPARAAELRARELLAAAVTGRLQARGEPMAPETLGEALDRYLEWVETNRPKALRDRRCLAAVWRRVAGDVPLARLDVEAFKAARLAEGVEPATVNRGVAMMKHLAGVASRAGWMTREQASVIRDAGMLREPPGRQRPIKPRELEALLAALRRADSRFARRVVAAALLTGCRLGELITLRDGQVDLRKRTIDLSETKQNRNHQIMITPPLAALIREAQAEPERGDVVFPNRFGRPYTVTGFSHHFGEVAARAGVPDLTFHDLRRHVGTVLVNAGERLEVVSKLLGHSNVAVTQRSYAHLTSEATRAAFARLASVAPALPPAPPAPSRNRRKDAAPRTRRAVS